MGNGQPFTKTHLVVALKNKRVTVLDVSAQWIADAIRVADLDLVMTGFRHDGKGVNFARGYELVFGERLK